MTIIDFVVLATDPEARVRFPALPKKNKKNSGSGTGSTQPREYKLRSYLIEKVAALV
jgi:hypothetical protein